ncbi:type II toxin-antitoxin system HicB family antitoxin [Halalkalibacter sp. APA_J-10(15)]|uniref:type II toxin-antitoxin system HicB family antitoxin n=1 Tax=unclassified Halalkalibacter TaxID=2893063 RepID=UPI001FF2978B|nr:type II toxin-antitoxin system HicB family antitoxin [Halalkalibacter sp. APA_J-10(15)]MCK0471271.1 type II toxin-antitoxin system HicB family antitoxin [Halalkalibacter sp. APA_J-10(15)]
MKYRPSDFHWNIRKVWNWMGQREIMIEIVDLDNCVSFGRTVNDAKNDLEEALYQWIRKNGMDRLPEVRDTAQLIYIEKEMEKEEFDRINEEIKEMKL